MGVNAGDANEEEEEDDKGERAEFSVSSRIVITIVVLSLGVSLPAAVSPAVEAVVGGGGVVRGCGTEESRLAQWQKHPLTGHSMRLGERALPLPPLPP